MKKYYKLVSLNPERYIKLDKLEAKIRYASYCNLVDESGIGNIKPEKFKWWLEYKI